MLAREQDESTGYVLPNKALIEIGITDFVGLLCCKTWCIVLANSPFFNSKAKKIPTTTGDLQRIMKSEYPCIKSKKDAYNYYTGMMFYIAATWEYIS